MAAVVPIDFSHRSPAGRTANADHFPRDEAADHHLHLDDCLSGGPESDGIGRCTGSLAGNR